MVAKNMSSASNETIWLHMLILIDICWLFFQRRSYPENIELFKAVIFCPTATKGNDY